MVMFVSMNNDYISSSKRVNMINSITKLGDIYEKETKKDIYTQDCPTFEQSQPIPFLMK